MTDLVVILIVLAVLGLFNLYCSVLILRRINIIKNTFAFLELRWQVHKHMRKYCELTKSEDGRVGFAYYGYWGSLILLVVAVVFVVLKGAA